jgi:hypothetical protein
VSVARDRLVAAGDTGKHHATAARFCACDLVFV